MAEQRIYEKKHNIETANTKAFYNERAKKLAEMDNPYVSVLLGDQDPTHAEQWNKYEKEFILPQLKIDKNASVLDIGCGIGRWAESVIPLAGYYFGTDFSEEMFKTARNRCSRGGGGVTTAPFIMLLLMKLRKKMKAFFLRNLTA